MVATTTKSLICEGIETMIRYNWLVQVVSNNNTPLFVGAASWNGDDTWSIAGRIIHINDIYCLVNCVIKLEKDHQVK